MLPPVFFVYWCCHILKYKYSVALLSCVEQVVLLFGVELTVAVNLVRSLCFHQTSDTRGLFYSFYSSLSGYEFFSSAQYLRRSRVCAPFVHFDFKDLWECAGCIPSRRRARLFFSHVGFCAVSVVDCERGRVTGRKTYTSSSSLK